MVIASPPAKAADGANASVIVPVPIDRIVSLAGMFVPVIV